MVRFDRRNDASRLVPFAVTPRPCSTACRRCGEGHERQPFGRVRPACRSSTCRHTFTRRAMPAATRSRSRIRTSSAGTVNSGVSAGIGRSQRQTRLPLWPRRIALVAFPAFLVFRVESNGRRSSGGFLQSRCLVGKPSSKIGGKIGPKRYRRSLSVLFVGRVQDQSRAWSASSTTCPTVIEANSPLRSPVSTSVL